MQLITVLSSVVVVAFLPIICAQTCPSGSLYTSYVRDINTNAVRDACCYVGFDLPVEDYECQASVSTTNTVYDCYSSKNTTITIKKGTTISHLWVMMAGGYGQDVGTILGGRTTSRPFSYTGPTPVPEDLNLAVWMNYGSTHGQYGPDAGGGGGYTAVGDAACAATHPSGVFPDPNDGVECRQMIAGGGGGASKAINGGLDAGPGRNGNAGSLPRSGASTNSNGLPPYLNAAGVYSGGAGGAGLRGGGAGRPPFTDGSDLSTASGAGGSLGYVSGPWRVGPSGLNGGTASVGRIRFSLGSPDTRCVYSVTETETTYASTTTFEETRYIETVYTPTGTVTEMPTNTVTITPAVSTVTEQHTEEIDLGPDYYTVDVLGGTRTPLTSTVQVSTDVTQTPEPTTTTVTVTPDTSTAYETEVVTSTPPTSTFTAVQTIATGHAACTTYRLVFPAACCPSNYVKLKPQREREVKNRRSIAFDKRAIAYSTVTVDGGVKIETRTVPATQIIGKGDATETSTVTTEVEAPTPLETITTTTTVTLPQPQVPVYSTYYDEAETPLAYETSTYTHEAETPVVTDTSTAPVPMTTITEHSTTMLAQPVTTTTSTAYAQATTCAARTVYTQAACPLNLPILKQLDQTAQVLQLNLYRSLGNNPVIVDCGSAGVFTY
ncbi:hypothetical protein JCM8547_007394 [Rhodosporidiobolus lusitaniae]